MAEELVLVYTTYGQAQANLIKSLLEAEGIPVLITQEGAGVAYGFTVGLLGRADVFVAAAQAAEARELLEAMERDELDDEAEP